MFFVIITVLKKLIVSDASLSCVVRPLRESFRHEVVSSLKEITKLFRESWWVCALAANKIVTGDVNYKSGAEVLSNMVIGIATKYSNKGFML